jgi:hypothetical protein
MGCLSWLMNLDFAGGGSSPPPPVTGGKGGGIYKKTNKRQPPKHPPLKILPGSVKGNFRAGRKGKK